MISLMRNTSSSSSKKNFIFLTHFSSLVNHAIISRCLRKLTFVQVFPVPVARGAKIQPTIWQRPFPFLGSTPGRTTRCVFSLFSTSVVDPNRPCSDPDPYSHVHSDPDPDPAPDPNRIRINSDPDPDPT